MYKLLHMPLSSILRYNIWIDFKKDFNANNNHKLYNNFPKLASKCLNISLFSP